MAKKRAGRLEWMPVFLAALAETGIVRRSVKQAGIALPTAYDTRHRYPDFARAWDEALAGRDHRADRIAALCAPVPSQPVPSVPGPCEDAPPGRRSRYWQDHFFEALGQTSNVSKSAAQAKVELNEVNRLRREEPAFAARWLAALNEGYDHLEMELLGYLRDPRPPRKMDVGAALRLLAAHRETVERRRAMQDEDDEDATLESIDAFIEDIRQRRFANEAILLEAPNDNEAGDGAD